MTRHTVPPHTPPWIPFQCLLKAMRSAGSRAFTLIELLIVLAILAVLAAVALPMFAPVSQDAHVAALQTNQHILNDAVERYRLEHGGALPGEIAGATEWEHLVTHLTTQTDAEGNPGTDHGPYLRTGIPLNPINHSRKGALYELPLAIDPTIGWYYKAATGEIIANPLAQAELPAPAPAPVPGPAPGPAPVPVPGPTPIIP